MLSRIKNFALHDRVENRRLFFLVFSLLVIAVAFAGLNGSLQNADEATFAFISREMLQRGSWIVQYEFGEPTMMKSPMVFWTAMLSFRTFGIGDFAARLPAALANIATCFALFFIGRKLYDSYKTGLLAVLIYQVSLQVNANAHQVCTDVLYQAFLFIGLLFVIKGLREKTGWFLVAGLCNGLVFLSKSALGLVLPAAVLLFILVERRWRLLWWLAALFLLSLAVSLPYFIAAYLRVPEVFKAEFLGSYLAGAAVGERSRDVLFILYGFVYFFVVLIVMMLPYSPGLAFVLLRKKRPVGTGEIIWRDERKLLSLLFLVCYVGFSVIERRLPHYTLPMIPCLALFLAYDFKDPRQGGARYMALLLFAAAAVTVFTVFVIKEGSRYRPFLDVAVGLIAVYLLFIGLNLGLYLKQVPAALGLFVATLVFFLAFTVMAWVTVPLDFNPDIKSFAPVYQGPAPVYVIGSKKADEGRKKRVIYWYLGTPDTRQYGSLQSFRERVEEVPGGSYLVFNREYTGELKGHYPSLEVLKEGIVWNIGVCRKGEDQ